jgi:general stress protein 26
MIGGEFLMNQLCLATKFNALNPVHPVNSVYYIHQERAQTMSMELIEELMQSAGYGDVASCVDGQPRVRPMAFVLVDGHLWSSTHRTSGKVTEFENNNRVEVCFTAANKVHVRITGIVDLSGGPDKKRRLLELNPKVRRHFDDEHDPKYVHVDITPTHIRWTEPGFGEYHTIDL